ncbi:hypothetical protein JQ596_18610 [Bradyrhizobium manausense]|uniref:hypothetical protein n=1 Tax=Bradyrhizobium TaxID=374 RepID=UPI001BABA75C|nr:MULTISPECIES: hypothetical protein [Bradyrhizobium]MBR0827541.1 hypothetical protein [Bradyrhizobium manausense]UVO26028.1 hypothetical protein KUF59_26070 [Bradyrhizobium arachidis]
MSDLEETEHESFKLPTNKNIPIWRYMDLAKFLSMLNSRALFFPRATSFDDPFEGSAPKPLVLEREYIRTNRTTDPSLELWKDVPDDFFDQMRTMRKDSVQQYLINCWHMSEFESAAMWKLYSTTNESVCVRSTYRRLRSCLPQSVFIGEVNYIDYDKQSFPGYQALNYIMHKRISFSHERELRAVFWEWLGTPEAQPYKRRIGASGLSIEIDLSSLIEQVYVSPTAAPWFAKLVEDMTAKCGFAFPVGQSALATAPLY